MRLELNQVEIFLLKSINYHVRWEDIKKIEFDGACSAWITTGKGTIQIWWTGLDDEVNWPEKVHDPR